MRLIIFLSATDALPVLNKLAEKNGKEDCLKCIIVIDAAFIVIMLIDVLLGTIPAHTLRFYMLH